MPLLRSSSRFFAALAIKMPLLRSSPLNFPTSIRRDAQTPIPSFRTVYYQLSTAFHLPSPVPHKSPAVRVDQDQLIVGQSFNHFLNLVWLHDRRIASDYFPGSKQFAVSHIPGSGVVPSGCLPLSVENLVGRVEPVTVEAIFGIEPVTCSCLVRDPGPDQIVHQLFIGRRVVALARRQGKDDKSQSSAVNQSSDPLENRISVSACRRRGIVVLPANGRPGMDSSLK